MKITLKRLTLAIAGAGLLTVYGCGGGSSSSSTSTTPITLGGINATGAAFTDAVITVVDSRGVTVGTSSVIGADGVFSITLSAGAVAPFVLTSSRTSAEGAIESLVSVVPAVTGSSATVNITPVTNLIASRLSSSGDPLKLATELAAGNSVVNATTVAATVADVQAILDPVLQATGTAGTNPLTGTFAANGTGYDRLLDSIQVTITPTSATAANVDIGIKQSLPEGTAPTAIQFASGAGQPAAASVPALPAANLITGLVPSGTSALIAAHLNQLNACYALPLASRVTPANISGATATGTEANIVAAACRDAFIQTGGVISFLSNGKVVSDSGAFSSLFREAATGVVFSQGTYEFTRGNGDIVVGYKSKDLAGNETFDTFALRNEAGVLKQIGNQYAYPGGVTAYHQLRDFVNQSASTYYSTGYTLNVPLIAGITHVKVTTPKGTTVTLIRGSDGMVFPKLNANRQTIDSSNNLSTAIPGMAPSGTNYIRVRSEYSDTALSPTPAHPAARETGLFFVPSDETDALISGYGNQSLWTFKYYGGGTTSETQQGVTQYFKTRTRASTIAEMRTRRWANLSAASLADLVANYVETAPSSGTFYTKLSSTANIAPTWEVAAGALPPIEIKLFGNTFVYPFTDPNTKTSFNDGRTVGTTTRSTTLPCANGSGEVHCASSGYRAYASMSGLHLRAKDASGSEFTRFYATYNLP